MGSIYDLGVDAEALGGVTDFPEFSPPRVVKPPFADPAAFRNARLPAMDRDGRMPGVLEAHRLVKQRIGCGVAVGANVEGPVTKALLYRGSDDLMRDLIRDPLLARELTAFATEAVIGHIRHLAETGVDFVFVAAAADGPAMIGPKFYLEYTIPNLRRLADEARSLGLPLIFHPHGRFTDNAFLHLVEAALDCGIAGFQFPENCDLGKAKKLWGRRVSILGGLDIATVLTPGPISRIRDEVRRIIDQAAPGGGYVFMPTCSLHRGDPLDHIEAMVDAVREFGVY